MRNQTESFDYIIVGAGSAGCVLANRLTADGSCRVLLLESGSRDRDPLIHIPLGIGRLSSTNKYDWGYASDPEENVDRRAIEATRGKVLGGSSSVNMMMYTRGDSSDFDRWAADGARGWSYADVQPYFKRLETWERGATEHRGGEGPVGVMETKGRDPVSDAWLSAAATRGYLGNSNPASGSIEGFGRAQYTIRNGRRSSAATAYLKPALKRRNLDLRTNATATALIYSDKTVVGVEYIDRTGTRVSVSAAREVLLCGGTYNSPQLLMLSGIGPKQHLDDMGIPLIADSPVGQNLQEHASLLNVYERTASGPFRAGLRFDRIARGMVQAYFLGTGPATDLPTEIVGFIKSLAELPQPDIELLLLLAPRNALPWFPLVKKPYPDVLSVRTVLLHPKSRGQVLLRSTNPTDRVRIQFGFFSNPDDLAKLREAFRIGRSLIGDSALDTFRGRELVPSADIQSDDELDAFIRSTLTTVAHPVGTCRMGSDERAVVDPDLRVIGVDGLRVVDASVMPDLITAHINACVLMIAEKAADHILLQARAAPENAKA